MIARLNGSILEKAPQHVVLDVQGVGYKLLIPVSTYYRLGEPGSPVTLRVHTHVREDALQLFGFWTALEQKLFEHLISVAGVGPKLAIGILSGIEAPELIDALGSGDLVRLCKIPGVGKKTAQRLVIELKEKLPPGDEKTTTETDSSIKQDLLSALQNLGYSRGEAERGAKRVLEEAGDEPFEDQLRRALQLLSGGPKR